MTARMWASHHRENNGDPVGAIAEAEGGLALVRDSDGPWLGAMLHTVIATLNAQVGHPEDAVHHALAALPVLDRLEATDDAIQTRALLAVHAISVGRLDEAEGWIAEIDGTERHRADFGGAFVLMTARAELSLARGRVAEGLGLYRVAVAELAALTFPGMGSPTGMEPWALFGESAGTTAFAVHGVTEADLREGAALFTALLAKASAVLEPDRWRMDYPVAGLVLHGLGAWGLLREAMPAPVAVRLLVLAERFGYHRYTPTMDPARTEQLAEQRAPGVAALLRSEYGDRTAPELLPEARRALADARAVGAGHG